jgi:hypothetical protein
MFLIVTAVSIVTPLTTIGSPAMTCPPKTEPGLFGYLIIILICAAVIVPALALA